MRAAAAPVAELSLGDALWLAPRRPHVLTVEVEDPAGALPALQERVVEALVEAVGYEPERRRFRPHVTVARVRAARCRAAHRAARRAAGGRSPGEALTLYRSWLGGGPARYEALERVVL